MAQRHDTAPDASRVPVLVAPRRESVVDGHAVTFEWEPVPAAAACRLEVAADGTFDRLLLDVDVTGRTSLTVYDTFDTDGYTHYWRILATDRDGYVHGTDAIESFVAGTADEAARAATMMTGGDEKFGPVGGLFKGAGAEMAAEVTGSPAYYEKEASLGVAHEGIAAGQIFAIMLGVVLAVVLIFITLIQYTSITAQETRYRAAGLDDYPERRTREESARKALSEYGVVEGGTYRIPIERAMDLIATESASRGGTYTTEVPLPRAASGQAIGEPAAAPAANEANTNPQPATGGATTGQ